MFGELFFVGKYGGMELVDFSVWILVGKVTRFYLKVWRMLNLVIRG